MARLTFSLGPTCGGTNHYDVTFRLGPKSTTLPVQHSDFSEPLRPDEEEVFFSLLIRFLVDDLLPSNRDASNVRLKLRTASLILSL